VSSDDGVRGRTPLGVSVAAVVLPFSVWKPETNLRGLVSKFEYP
jgi:hypothetical protein